MRIYYVSGVPFGDELYHHGIKGQKWGIRRYQNLDGSLTPAGRERYSSEKEQKKFADKLSRRKWTIEESNALNNSPQIREIASKLKNEAKRYSDAAKAIEDATERFYSDRSFSDKYRRMAIDKVLKEWPEAFGGASKKEIFSEFDYLDAFQNEYDPFEIFRSNKSDKRNIEYDRLEREYGAARKDMEKTAKQYTNVFLGKYGNQEMIPGVTGYTIADSAVVRAIGVAREEYDKTTGRSQR